jgi:hypothetical protein
MDPLRGAIQSIDAFLPIVHETTDMLESSVPISQAVREFLAEQNRVLAGLLKRASATFAHIERVLDDMGMVRELRTLGVRLPDSDPAPEPTGEEHSTVTLHIVCPHCLQCLRSVEWPRADVESAHLFYCDLLWGGCGAYSIIDAPDAWKLEALNEGYVMGYHIPAYEAAEYIEAME